MNLRASFVKLFFLSCSIQDILKCYIKYPLDKIGILAVKLFQINLINGLNNSGQHFFQKIIPYGIALKRFSFLCTLHLVRIFLKVHLPK